MGRKGQPTGRSFSLPSLLVVGRRFSDCSRRAATGRRGRGGLVAVPTNRGAWSQVFRFFATAARFNKGTRDPCRRFLHRSSVDSDLESLLLLLVTSLSTSGASGSACRRLPIPSDLAGPVNPPTHRRPRPPPPPPAVAAHSSRVAVDSFRLTKVSAV
jgi:hypothetical protein